MVGRSVRSTRDEQEDHDAPALRDLQQLFAEFWFMRSACHDEDLPPPSYGGTPLPDGAPGSDRSTFLVVLGRGFDVLTAAMSSGYRKAVRS
jgi:hypothetical protein